MTQWDIANMGPRIGMTDDNITLLHPEHYPQDWYNDTFVDTDWEAVLNGHEGTIFRSVFIIIQFRKYKSTYLETICIL